MMRDITFSEYRWPDGTPWENPPPTPLDQLGVSPIDDHSTGGAAVCNSDEDEATDAAEFAIRVGASILQSLLPIIIRGGLR